MRDEIGSRANASPRPWRIEATVWTKRRGIKPGSLILAANNETVAVCHPDNAALIVAAVNEMGEAERLREELAKANSLIFDLEFANGGGR